MEKLFFCFKVYSPLKRKRKTTKRIRLLFLFLLFFLYLNLQRRSFKIMLDHELFARLFGYFSIGCWIVVFTP